MKRDKSSLLILEIVFMILVFSISAAVAITIFSKAEITAGQSKDLSKAAIEAQSAAECFRSAQGDLEVAAWLFGATSIEGGFSLSYDAEWTPNNGSDFLLTLTETTLGEAVVSITQGEQEIFTLDVKVMSNETD